MLSDTLGKLEIKETTAKSILSDIIMIDGYNNDIQRYLKDEQRLLSKISESGYTRSLQEAISDQNSVKSLIKNICNTLEKNQHELSEYNESLHALQIQQNKITSDELNIKSKMQDVKGVMNKLKDLQNLEATLSIELDSTREAIEPIQKQLEICIKNFDQIKKQHKQNIEMSRKEVILNQLYKKLFSIKQFSFFFRLCCGKKNFKK